MKRCLNGVPIFLMQREERVRTRPFDEQVVHVVDDVAVDVPFRPNRMDVLRWDLDVAVAGQGEHGNTHMFEPLPDVIGCMFANPLGVDDLAAVLESGDIRPQ